MPSAAEAVADIPDGASLAVGGFGLSGIPDVAHPGPARPGRHRSARSCRTTAVWTAADSASCWPPAGSPASPARYVGENKEFARQYLSGELEVELVPQGTLAERLRAGGAGIPAFYTPAGVGTQVADGGLPWRYASDGTVAVASPPKETRDFDGPRVRPGARHHHRLRPRTGLARRPPRQPRLPTSRPPTSTRSAAMAGRITVAEVEELVEPGELSPDEVHLPGIFVQRVVELTAAQAADKRDREADTSASSSTGHSMSSLRLDPRPDGRPRRRRTHRRLLRQPRHRPAHPDPRPPPAGRARGPALGERHPRHRPATRPRTRSTRT